MAGRRPIPDVLKDLSGSKNLRNPNSPRFQSVENVPVLKAVARDEYALELWNELLPELIPNGLVTRASVRWVGAMCQAYAAMMHAEDDVFERGRVLEQDVFSVKTGEVTGQKEVPNPAIAQASHARQEFLRFAVEFGITPAAMTRVKAVAPNDETRRKSFGDFIGDEEELPNATAAN